MIYKNAKHYTSENVTILEFGKGDIITSCLHHEDPTIRAIAVGFLQNKEGDIGRGHPEMDGKKISETGGVDVVMTFNKIESIDVVIELLNKAKFYLTEKLTS